jgi:FtsH-binding integral membrane protein
MLKTGVFERTDDDDSMTRGAFYLVIGATLTWGFGLTAMVSQMTRDWVPDNMWVFFGIGLGIPIAGILLSLVKNAFVSFLGFNMVAGGMAVILGPALKPYIVEMPDVVMQAAILTAGVTGVMAVSGLMFPNFYRSIGGALFGALFALVAVGIAGLFIPELQGMTWIHYVAAGIFALYIGFDMWRASMIPATLDNAVDVSVSLYLDILNLFLRILIILGKAKR